MNSGAQKLILILFAAIMLSAGCGNQRQAGNNKYNIPLLVGENKIFVEVADTNQKRSQGLSGQKKLKGDQGMLFIFDSPGNYGFWMKDMKFDLDLIWIRNGKIVGITPNVPHPKSPGNTLPLYYPPLLIDMVLEVNAGWSDERKVKMGDEIKFVN